MHMAKSKRILFTFDPRSEQNLRKLTDTGGFPSASDAVRDAVLMARALQEQERLGFTELVVRNPTTHEEKVMVFPWISATSGGDDRAEVERATKPQPSPAEKTGAE
jgi:Arc/MetJ-type ribon-helix-helix transcriptional regulator